MYCQASSTNTLAELTTEDGATFTTVPWQVSAIALWELEVAWVLGIREATYCSLGVAGADVEESEWKGGCEQREWRWRGRRSCSFEECGSIILTPSVREVSICWLEATWTELQKASGAADQLGGIGGFAASSHPCLSTAKRHRVALRLFICHIIGDIRDHHGSREHYAARPAGALDTLNTQRLGLQADDCKESLTSAAQIKQLLDKERFQT